MADYRVGVTDSVTGWLYLEADSPEQAEKLAQEIIDNEHLAIIMYDQDSPHNFNLSASESEICNKAERY